MRIELPVSDSNTIKCLIAGKQITVKLDYWHYILIFEAF